MQKAFEVSAPGGAVTLMIKNQGDPLPVPFALLGASARHRVCIRLTGGCKGMSGDDKSDMIAFFSRALKGFAGTCFSGGTQQAKGEEVDPMVTDIPGIIASENAGVVALGTVPRTELLTLRDRSRLVLDQYGTGINPSMSSVLIVQKNAADSLGWDGDLPDYLQLMDYWKTYAGFEHVGIVAWNGGAVTESEIMESAKRGWPTILIKGSGRVTDEIAAKLEAGDEELIKALPANHQVVAVSKNDPEGFRNILILFGFIRPELQA